MSHMAAFFVDVPLLSLLTARYWTIAEPYTHEVEIKKSQFIATAWPVKSASEVGMHRPTTVQGQQHITAALQ